MSLETMRPNPTWDEASYQEAVDTLAAHDDLVYKVWGSDWCKDCRKLLPNLGAALEAADIPEAQVEEYALDEDKQGEGVEEYDIEYIPTVVVETTNGEEVTRFVESADLPPAVWLAAQLEEQR